MNTPNPNAPLLRGESTSGWASPSPRIIVAGMLLATIVTSLGQTNITFTKITTGPVVTDRGEFYGCAWGDYDNDGLSDLFVANSGSSTTNYLYRNRGDGTFARMTINDVGSVVGDRGTWHRAAWGDYNNDGFLDLYVSGEPRSLYHNNGDGRFTRVTTNGPPVTDTGRSHAVAWGDYDNDGYLDLLVAAAFRDVGTALYHNDGNGMFTKVTSGPVAGDRVPGFYGSYSGAWSDFDNDGDLDLVVGAGDPTWVYRNNGAGGFSRITWGPLPQDSGFPTDAGWGDYDNDGLMDLFIAHWNVPCRLFHNDGGGQFTKILFPPGSYDARGGTWGDYDNDGYLDLFIVLGANSAGNNLLYHNNGNGTFTQVTTGSLVVDGGHSTCAAWCDYDNNGFLDLFVANYYEANFLYRNNGNSNGWLMVKLLGTKSNRAAIGAKVRVQATINGTSVWQKREISGGSGYEDDLRANFGLGNATVVNKLRIEWPSGVVEEFGSIPPRQILTIVEPSLKGSMGEDGKMHVAMTMSTNRLYQLQASTDLVTWTTLTNCTGSGSCEPIEYVDPEAPAAGAARFYRMK